jgi:transposase
MPRRKSPTAPPDPAVAALLQTLTPHAAGIAVGATELWVCVPPSAVPSPAAPNTPAVLPPHVRRFGTCTMDLPAIAAGLRQCQVTTVAMESTGVYWIPLYDLLESARFQGLLVDPRQVQRAPNRPKTDVHDCQWSQQDTPTIQRSARSISGLSREHVRLDCQKANGNPKLATMSVPR